MMTEREERLQAAKAALEGGQPAEAVQQLASWTQKHPEEAEAWELLVRAYFELKRWPAAYLALQQLTRLRPQSAPVWSNLGIVLRHMNRLQEAVEAQTRALQLDPTLKRAKQELEHLRRLLPHASPAPAAAASAVPPASPTVAPASAPEAAEEELFPIYCRRCRRPIARAESDAHQGLCALCFADQQQQQFAEQEQQIAAEFAAIATTETAPWTPPDIIRTAREMNLWGWIFFGIYTIAAIISFISGFIIILVSSDDVNPAIGGIFFGSAIVAVGGGLWLQTLYKAAATHLCCLHEIKEAVSRQRETLELIYERLGRQ